LSKNKRNQYSLIISDRIKIRILKLLAKEELTTNQISQRVRSNYRTVKKALIFLEKLQLVQKETIKLTSKKIITIYKVTDLGWKIIEKIQREIDNEVFYS
jgi:DNA-binding PadR family transcriptional regulator